MNTKSLDMIIKKVDKSRVDQLDPQNIQFGRLYTDHMLKAYYKDGKWGQAEIVPYGPLSLPPSTTFIHYGQSIFEGVKAYRNPQGNPVVFRPEDNARRFNRSARRMAMPEVPESLFVDGIRQLIDLDREWVPEGKDCSLYIRPFMVATDEFIGVKPAQEFCFMIICSPAGPYYAKPVSIYIQDEFVRAFPGGIGFTKAAGNYGATMYPVQEIRKMGYDQILWTDAIEHKYVQEIGTMNVFFRIGDTMLTPNLSDTILEGITRDSVLRLIREKGLAVEERPISVEEIVKAYEDGQLKEAFGTGTAASISFIGRITYKDKKLLLPEISEWETGPWLKKELDDIRYGRVADRHNWLLEV